MSLCHWVALLGVLNIKVSMSALPSVSQSTVAVSEAGRLFNIKASETIIRVCYT